jgi:hypothetical protein
MTVGGPARATFEEHGYTVHTSTLRHHELPLQEGGPTAADRKKLAKNLSRILPYLTHCRPR